MKKIVTSGMRDCTINLDGSECAVKFGTDYRTFAVRNNGDADIIVSIEQGKTAEDDGVRIIHGGESGMLSHMRSDVDTVYITGSGNVEVNANNTSENPFKNGGKGGVTKADLDKITPQLLFSGVTSADSPAVVDLSGYEMVMVKSQTEETDISITTDILAKSEIEDAINKNKLIKSVRTNTSFINYRFKQIDELVIVYTNSASSIISIYGIYQHTALKIYSQPEDVTVSVGDKITISVGAYGDDLTYQWQYRMPEGNIWNDISGSNSNTFVSNNAALSRSGRHYRCVISDKWGDSVTSNAATLTVVTEILTPIEEELGG